MAHHLQEKKSLVVVVGLAVLFMVVAPRLNTKALLIAVIQNFESDYEHNAHVTYFFFGEKSPPLSIQELSSYSKSDTVQILRKIAHVSFVGWDRPLFIPRIDQFSLVAITECEVVAGEASFNYREYYIWYVFGWKRIYRKKTGTA